MSGAPLWPLNVAAAARPRRRGSGRLARSVHGASNFYHFLHLPSSTAASSAIAEGGARSLHGGSLFSPSGLSSLFAVREHGKEREAREHARAHDAREGDAREGEDASRGQALEEAALPAEQTWLPRRASDSTPPPPPLFVAEV